MKTLENHLARTRVIRRNAQKAFRRGDLAAAERWMKLLLLQSKLDIAKIDLAGKIVREAKRIGRL